MEKSVLSESEMQAARHVITRRAALSAMTAAAAYAFTAPPAFASDANVDHQLGEYSENAPLSPQARDDLLRFYQLRRKRRAWNDENSALATQALTNAGRDGLNPDNYLFDADKETDSKLWDIQLSAAFLRYARDLRTGGVTPGAVYDDVDLPKQNFDAPGDLAEALQRDSLSSFLSQLPPQRKEYAFLRDALTRYRDIAAANPWPRISWPAGEVAQLPKKLQGQLWVRLAREDTSMPAQAIAAGDLAKALRRFQTRMGLAADGHLGPKTIAALNVSADQRVKQIDANMERWRWMPYRPEARYVEINAADASLIAIDNGAVVVTSPVVLGRRNWRTPLLATKMVAVILNPPWPVPGVIASAEIAPKLVKDRTYLAKNNMVLVNGPPNDKYGTAIKWRNVRRNPFPYVIEQEPGPRNVLGAFLIDMPNRFDVYLHDTPSQALFDKTERYFSHGCVRAQQIAALASFMLLGDPTATIEQRASLPRDQSARLPLPEPMTAYMSYWTVFADGDRQVAFRSDAYGRDDLLIAALDKRRSAKRKRVESADLKP